MGSTPEVELLLGLMGTFHRVPLASIAAITHVPQAILRESLSRLVFALRDPRGELPANSGREPTEGGSETDGFGTVPNGSVPNGSVPRTEETVPTETVPTAPTDARVTASATPLTAESLATALDDLTNLDFYRSLMSSVPAELLAHALDETLSRRDRLHGRPGGYFTAVIHRLTRDGSPYARTPPTSPGSPASPP